MSQSKMKVSIGFLEAVCLGHDAQITDLEIVRRVDGSKYLVLNVEGPDVPQSEFVHAIVSQTIQLVPS